MSSRSTAVWHNQVRPGYYPPSNQDKAWYVRIANSFPRVILIGAIALTISATIFKFAENQRWEDSFYWAVTTITTTGYGDLLPKTDGTKLLAGLTMLFWGFVMTPLILANFLRAFIINKHEFTHDEQEELEEDVDTINGKVDKLTELVMRALPDLRVQHTNDHDPSTGR